MIFAPIGVLSAIFVIILAGIAMSEALALASTATILTIGAVTFLSAVSVLSLRGWNQIRTLQDLGLTDSLTGMPNRRALHGDYRRDTRDGTEVALALIDLDGFNKTNEHYGRQVGDMALRECGNLIAGICAEEATVYRLGADEFALLKTGPLAATILEGLCHRVVDRLRAPLRIEERRLTMGASIGLARCSEDADLGSSELLRRADMAMNASKTSGKNRCTWFRPDFDRNREEARELDDDLRLALAREEFEVHYQPLVDCETRSVVAVESLIRWNRPDGRPIGPSEFIPAAESSGLINPIGLWVLRTACRDALAWPGIRLSVNISAAQLRNPEFPIQLGLILEETGLDPERLELEITETCLVVDPVVAERSLSVIRGFGVKVVLDDFGTGYASIGFLRQFRFEKLKLDRSLVVHAAEDDGSRAMMLSSITVARAMKMGVTAEGVETREQAEMVRAAGCDHIQGWLYFKAMPASQIGQYLGKVVDTADSANLVRFPQNDARVA